MLKPAIRDDSVTARKTKKVKPYAFLLCTNAYRCRKSLSWFEADFAMFTAKEMYGITNHVIYSWWSMPGSVKTASDAEHGVPIKVAHEGADTSEILYYLMKGLWSKAKQLEDVFNALKEIHFHLKIYSGVIGQNQKMVKQMQLIVRLWIV